MQIAQSYWDLTFATRIIVHSYLYTCLFDLLIHKFKVLNVHPIHVSFSKFVSLNVKNLFVPFHFDETCFLEQLIVHRLKVIFRMDKNRT